MRAVAFSADRISGCVIFIAALLSGVLVLFVAMPLALSSPYPVLRDQAWELSSTAVAARSAPLGSTVRKSSLRVASLGSVPVMSPVPAAQIPNATDSVEEEIVTESIGLFGSASIGPRDAPAPQLHISPAEAAAEAPAPKGGFEADNIDQYLWHVYQRSPVKRDSSGDFSWKDPAAAKHMGKPMPAYVIGGMDPDFREQLYHAGRAMDAAGLHWSMLSAFRDDYRQSLASGFKARTGNSLHGGSRRTGGYGHGQAADITNASGDASAVWRWIDRNGAKYGLSRPMPGADPAHIQPRGNWRKIAMALRETRLRLAEQQRRAPMVKTAAVRAEGAAAAAW